MTAPVPARRLRRSRTDAVLGGVCAGVARSAGLDPLLLRIAVVAVTVLTGGAGVPAYLVAWVLIPREPLDAATTGPVAQPVTDARAAWTAAGNDLRSLTTELRRPVTDDATAEGEATTGSGEPPAEGPPGTVPQPRSPLTAADDAATALGDRLRTPEVQAGARKAAAGVTEAVTASVDELARRVHRERS